MNKLKKEIIELRTEFLDIQKDIKEIQSRKDILVNKIHQLFKNDKNISFDDFKDAEFLLQLDSAFELAASERLDNPEIKKLIAENMIEKLMHKQKINFTAINDYFDSIDESEKIDNMIFFEHELDEIIEFKLKDVLDYIRNNLGEDPRAFFKDFYK